MFCDVGKIRMLGVCTVALSFVAPGPIGAKTCVYNHLKNPNKPNRNNHENRQNIQFSETRVTLQKAQTSINND